MASERPAHSCRLRREMSSRRYKVYCVVGRRSTGWPQFPGCGFCRASPPPACSSARRRCSDQPQPQEHQMRPAVLAAHPCRNAGLRHFDKDFAVRNLSGRDIHVEHADMRRVLRTVGKAGVDDVELLLVRREGNAVRLYEVVGDNLDLADSDRPCRRCAFPAPARP